MLFTAAGLALAVGCSAPSGTTPDRPTCDGLLRDTIALIRSCQTGDGYDDLSATIETMRTTGCPGQWAVFADYESARAMAEQYGPDTCATLAQYNLTATAIDLLREDGLCTADTTVPITGDPGGPGMPAGAVLWSDAAGQMGTEQQVCGPLAGVGTSDDDVFLNIGVNYPDPARFTIVLWDVGGVESLPVGTTVCATGTISAYEGVPQVELWSTDGVQVFQ